MGLNRYVNESENIHGARSLKRENKVFGDSKSQKLELTRHSGMSYLRCLKDKLWSFEKARIVALCCSNLRV